MKLPGPVEALLYALAAVGVASLVQAAEAAGGTGSPDQGPGAGQQGQPPGPPPEAIAACKGKTAGATASFTDRSGRTLSGNCTQIGGVLAIAPPAGGPTGGAPPQR